MIQHSHPFTTAPTDQPLIYYRPGWASRLPCIIRIIGSEPVLLTRPHNGKLGDLANLPTDAILEEPAAQ